MRVQRLALLGAVALFLLAESAGARSTSDTIQRVVPPFPNANDASRDASRTDTLWIFDADFEDLLGDNAGWTTEDLSGTVACSNYWHKDTIRIGDFTHLGDSTWWCGTYNDCWCQPRGYGNNWTCMLSRSFPELASATQRGDDLRLEYDQRYAIEACYDYAYTDVSTDGGASWTTLWALFNPSCWTHPGMSQDWDSVHPNGGGHMAIDMSDYAGQPVDLRFRFESDPAYSSQDMYNNPPVNSVLDGAWQIDNIAWYVNGELYWLDDCESPGRNGWVTDDTPASGQTGVLYRRELLEFDGREGWMMAAYDTASGTMVSGQNSWLYSPPIYVAGASELVVQWDGWVDLPDAGSLWDRVQMRHMTSDSLECLEKHLPCFPYHDWTESRVGPVWVSRTDSSFYYAGGDWVGLAFQAWDWDDTGPHGVGIAFDRIRVGIPGHTGSPDEDTVGTLVFEAHPNPLGPSTTIRYSLPARGQVTMRVHDLAGRVVRTLVDRDVEAGEYRAVWEGTTDSGDRAASGVYFVRMEATGHTDAFRATRKLVLLK